MATVVPRLVMHAKHHVVRAHMLPRLHGATLSLVRNARQAASATAFEVAPAHGQDLGLACDVHATASILSDAERRLAFELAYLAIQLW